MQLVGGPEAQETPKFALLYFLTLSMWGIFTVVDTTEKAVLLRKQFQIGCESFILISH